MATPVISVAQMREWEQITWAGGQTEAAVIARDARELQQISNDIDGWVDQWRSASDAERPAIEAKIRLSLYLEQAQ